MKVRKLVIPAAGWGTRFLPFTKAVHKELLPVLNKPLIQLLVEEAKEAGIEEIILILSERKTNIYDYFKPNKSLRNVLQKSGKTELLKRINDTTKFVNFKVIVQKEQLGLGHAVYLARNYLKNEPFAVILGDDLVYSKKKVAIKQLIDFYNEVQSTIFGVQAIVKKDVYKYGVVDPQSKIDERKYIIKGAVEKPLVKDAPSNLAILGRYVFTPNLWKSLEKISKKDNSEINLLDGIDKLMALEKVYAYIFEGTRYDLGSVEGFVKANIEYACRDQEIGADIRQYLKQLFVSKKY